MRAPRARLRWHVSTPIGKVHAIRDDDDRTICGKAPRDLLGGLEVALELRRRGTRIVACFSCATLTDVFNPTIEEPRK